MPNIPVFRSYDRKGNLIKEVRKDVEFSIEVEEAIARYIYALIKEEEQEKQRSEELPTGERRDKGGTL